MRSTSDRLERPLVVGAAGFLGSALVTRLARTGARVVAVDRQAKPDTGEPGVRRIAGDVVSLDLTALIDEAGITSIFQLAGSPTVGDAQIEPVADLVRNCGTTVAVLEAAARSSHRPVVGLVSSAAVYGQPAALPVSETAATAPVSAYGVSKLAAEQYVRFYATRLDVPAFAARCFSVYGPGQRKLVVHDLTVRALGGEDPLRVGAPASVVRDFAFVDDVIDALVGLARVAPGRGEAYNVCSGRGTSLGELVDAILAVTGSSASATFAKQAPDHDPTAWIGDPARLNALELSCDTPLEQGLEATATWLRAQALETV